MPPPPPSLPRRALMGLVVAAGVLTMVELGLRLLLGPAPNPVRVFGALGAHDQYFEIAYGMAHRAYGEAPLEPFAVRSSAPRLAMLGGSSIRDGTPNLHPDREVPGLLSTALGVEVVNLGSPGGLVMYTGHNDLGNALFETRYGNLPSAIFAYAQGGLSHLQLFSQLSRLVVPRTGTTRRTRPGMFPEADEVVPLDPMRRAVVYSAFRKNLERIAWLTGRRDQPMVWVLPVSDLTALPQKVPCEEGDCPSDWFSRARERNRTDPAAAVDILLALRDNDPTCLRATSTAEAILREVAAEYAHITLVEPGPLLARDPTFDVPNRRLFIDPVHFSAEGHRSLAELLVEPVTDSLLAP